MDMSQAPALLPSGGIRLIQADRALVEHFLANARPEFALGTDRTALDSRAVHLALVAGDGDVLGVGALLDRPGCDPELAIAVVSQRCAVDLICALARATAQVGDGARRVCTCYPWGGEPSAATLKGAGLSLCAQVACDGMTDVILEVEPTSAGAA
jgi:hypothetical protein